MGPVGLTSPGAPADVHRVQQRQAGNLDLALTPPGIVNGQSVDVGTHMVRAYTDSVLAFNVNRDNATTPGYALICVSGYVV